MCSDVSWDERIESKFFNRNTELAKLSFVGLHHVRVSLPDLFKFSLDFSDSLVLELLNLLESATNHAESLWVNASRRQNLIGLSVLRLKTLLDGLKLLLEDQVAQTSLTVHIIDHIVELLEQLLLFLLNVLILLEADLVLPLQTLVLFLSLNNLLLFLGELLTNLDVPGLKLGQSGDLLLDVLHWLDDHIVVRVPDVLLSIRRGFSLLFGFEISAKGANHVHVEASDVVVVQVDVLVLLVMLVLQLQDCLVLLGFDLEDLCLALSLHVFTQAGHLGLVLLLDFVCDALEFLSLGCGQSVVVLGQCVTVLGLADLLLLLLDFQGAQVLLELTLVNTMLIFGVLQLDLSLLLNHSLLV